MKNKYYIIIILILIIYFLYKNSILERFKQDTKVLAIHSVFILPENFVFLEEWIVYHLELGFSKFYLYDNYGSKSRGKGREGKNESTLNKTRYGIEFLKLTDYDIYSRFEILKKKYPGINYVKWQPKDNDGNITYSPGEAIAHYRDHFSKNSDWTAFIDPDEFIVLDDTKNNSLKDFIKKHDDNKITKLQMKQKKFQDRFCNIENTIFDINNIITNINVEGWAYKCIYKNKALDKDESNFFMHNIKTEGKSHLCDLNELRFNHYNVNNIQIDWMKGFLKKNYFEHGKDNSMKKFKYLLKKYNIPKHKFNKKYYDSIKNNVCYKF